MAKEENKEDHICIFCGKKASDSWTILNDNGTTTIGDTWLCNLHYIEASRNARKKKHRINQDR